MPRAVVLGADGFIGRHIAFRLRAKGYEVTASARRTSRLARMGFDTLRCDLTSERARNPEFWAQATQGAQLIINAAGILTGPERVFQSVHVEAPAALYKAAPDGCSIILLSAVGIDDGTTDFAAFRRLGEAEAQRHGALILRAGLVLGDTSYGGSSLARALAALPFVTPTVGRGTQVFNPIHADDLAEAMIDLAQRDIRGTYDIGGPENVSQWTMLKAYRSWMGMPRSARLPIPMWLARAVGRIGDAMRLGPISLTSVQQLAEGVHAQTRDITDRLTTPLRGFSQFVGARPAGTQDLWHARLFGLRPLLRLLLAVLWLASAWIGLTLPAENFLPLITSSAVPDTMLVAMARMGGLVDLAIGLALLRGWRPRLTAALQFVMIAGYTLGFTVLAPALWLLPLGGLLKNLPILALIGISAVLEDER